MGKRNRDRTRRRAQERRRKRAKKGPRARPGSPLGPAPAFVVDEATGTARHGISFPCPDCGVAAVLTHGDDDAPLVIHDEPRCEAFTALEPADYVAWSRRSTMPSKAPGPSDQQIAIEKVWATPPEDALTGRCHDVGCSAPNCLDPHASTHVVGAARLVILTYTSPDKRHRVRVNGEEVGFIDTTLDSAQNPVFSHFVDAYGELGVEAFMRHLEQRHRMMHGGLN